MPKISSLYSPVDTVIDASLISTKPRVYLASNNVEYIPYPTIEQYLMLKPGTFQKKCQYKKWYTLLKQNKIYVYKIRDIGLQDFRGTGIIKAIKKDFIPLLIMYEVQNGNDLLLECLIKTIVQGGIEQLAYIRYSD